MFIVTFMYVIRQMHPTISPPIHHQMLKLLYSISSISSTSTSPSTLFFSFGGLNPQYLQVSGYPVHGLPGTGFPPLAVHMLTGCGFCLALGLTPTSIVA
jgi:hypothetical protein